MSATGGNLKRAKFFNDIWRVTLQLKPSTSFCFVWGLISLHRHSFALCHKFSIGSKSGGGGGGFRVAFHQFTLIKEKIILHKFGFIVLGVPNR